MRKTLIGILALVSACSPKEGKSISPPKDVEVVTVNAADLTPATSFLSGPLLKLDSGEYLALLRLIEKRGAPVSHNNTQLVYWDKHENRHAVIAVFKPDTGPRSQARPMQISVWVNGTESGETKPGKEFFFYVITESGFVHYDCYCSSDSSSGKNTSHAKEILEAVNDLRKKARKL